MVGVGSSGYFSEKVVVQARAASILDRELEFVVLDPPCTSALSKIWKPAGPVLGLAVSRDGVSSWQSISGRPSH